MNGDKLLSEYDYFTIQNIVSNLNCTPENHPCWQDISFRARQHLMLILDIVEKEIFRIDVDLKIERVPDGYRDTTHALCVVFQLEHLAEEIKEAL